MKKENLKKLVAIATSVLTALTMSSCSNNLEDDKSKTSVDISNESTIDGVLETVSPYTLIDEAVEEMKADLNLGALLEEYNEARYSENAAECNSKLYKIGYVILKSTIAESLNINVNDIESISYDQVRDLWSSEKETKYKLEVIYNKENKNILPGNIEKIDNEKKKVEFYVDGEAYNFIFNMNKARLGAWEIETEYLYENGIDDVYKAYIRFLLSSGKLTEENYKKLPLYNYSIDSEKATAYDASR